MVEIEDQVYAIQYKNEDYKLLIKQKGQCLEGYVGQDIQNQIAVGTRFILA